MPANSFGKLCLLALLLQAGTGHAQSTSITVPTIPGTAGYLGTNVIQSGSSYDITGGTRNGSNLFHSFINFSVGSSDFANFTNDRLLPTSNIIGRVTGGATSNIYGTIQTTDFGNANLFLINPAGWIFGSSASLQVGGSFHVSTAHYLRFSDGAQFFADPTMASVLTSAPPTAFGFLPSAPIAPIVINGATLSVPEGQTLSVVGGDVQITGATLLAPSGRIQIGSFASAGEASIDGLNGDFSSLGHIDISGSTLSAGDIDGDPAFVNGGTVLIRGGQIDLSNFSLIDTSGTLTVDENFNLVSSTAGGSVVIRGGKLTMDSSTIMSNTSGDTNGGGIDVSLAESISVSNGSAIATQASADPVFFFFNSGLGRGGDVHVAAPTVTITGASSIATSTAGEGAAGSLGVQAGALTVSGAGSVISSSTVGNGRAGDVTVAATDLSVSAGASIGSSTIGGGRGGDVNISATNSISISGRDALIGPSSLFTSTASFGDAGQLTASAPSITLSGGGTIVTVSSAGRAGDVLVSANTLNVQPGSTVNSQSNGSGGSIVVLARGDVALSGDGPGGTPTGIFTATCPNCAVAGDISVQAGTITLSRGALIQSGSDIQPGGGSVTLTATQSIAISSGAGVSTQGSDQDVRPINMSAPNLLVDNGSISASTIGRGHGGSIGLQVGALTLTNGGQIASSTPQVARTGAGGDVSVVANSVSISGSSLNGPATPFTTDASSGIFSISQSFGNAGQISVNASSLTMSNGGTISVASTAAGAAGRIVLDVGNFALSSGAKVNSSTTGAGAGGAITLNGSSISIIGASGIFSTTSSAAGAGTIDVASSTLMLGSGGKMSASTTGTGKAGTISANIGALDMSGGATIESSTNSAGAGGAINISAGNASITGSGTTLSSTATSIGAAGQIALSGGSVNVADGARVSVTTSGAGKAGTISANIANITVSGGRLDSSTSSSGAGGAINISASGDVSVVNGGRISADSTGSGVTGNITIAAGDRITMTDGSISTRALTSDGGNITLTAPLLVRLENSQITTSVQSGTGGGGNIFVDPQFMIMNNSSITANAFGGPGGNITIVADNFLASSTALLAASSALSTPGTIQIQSPENNVAGSIAQLPRAFIDASRLMRGSCAARQAGAPSSFTLAGRGGVPPDADGYLPSLLASAPSAPLVFARLDNTDCAR